MLQIHKNKVLLKVKQCFSRCLIIANKDQLDQQISTCNSLPVSLDFRNFVADACLMKKTRRQQIRARESIAARCALLTRLHRICQIDAMDAIRRLAEENQ